jgi:cytochrome P450
MVVREMRRIRRRRIRARADRGRPHPVDRRPTRSLVTVNTLLHPAPRIPNDSTPNVSRPVKERIPRYAFLPFGGGPRVCIGNGFAMMETRLILAAVAQRCHLSLEPGQEITPVQLVTVRTKHGIKMRLRRPVAWPAIGPTA